MILLLPYIFLIQSETTDLHLDLNLSNFSDYFLVVEEPIHPCNPSPCGSNALCKERNGAGSCICVEGYFGDPYAGCRPECVTSNECAHDKACLNMKCRDPCPGTCGVNAECSVINHNPQCFCIAGYVGDPLTICRKIEPSKKTAILLMHNGELNGNLSCSN